MRHLLLLLGGVLAVGSAALLARLGLDAGMSAPDLALWRLTLAGIVLLLWRVAKSSSEPPLPAAARARLIGAGVCLAFHFVTWFGSLDYVSVARSTLLVTTSPLWAGLLGLAVPSLRPSRSFWAGLSLAAIGVALVTTQGAGRVGAVLSPVGMAWKGDLLAVAGGILVVPYLLLVQRVQAEFGTLRTVTWTYSAAAVCLWLLAGGHGHVTLPHTPSVWSSIVGMALVPQLLGHTALNRSLQHFTAGQVSTATLLEPIFAALLAWLLLGERITPGQAVGALLLLGGVALTLQKRQEQAAVSAEISTEG